MKKVTKYFFIIMSGMFMGINLSYLLPNPDYEYGWWKVVFAATIAITASAFWEEK